MPHVLQALVELGADAGGAEAAQHLAAASVMPVFSNRKMSCSVMMSCSMPTTSVMCVMRRVPSLKRETCTNRSTARRDLLADGADAHVGVGHADHHFQAAQTVARGVGVDRGERSVVTRVHGLQHVQRFFRSGLRRR